MYQAGVEAIMGFRLLGTTLVIDPCILRAWTGYEGYDDPPRRLRRDARGARRSRPSSTTQP